MVDAENDIMSQFKKNIDVAIPIPAPDWELCSSQMRRVKLRHGERLLRPGDRADFFAFVYRGLVKRYFMASDNRQIITSFDPENSLISDFASLLRESPARLTIEAIEDSELLVSEVGLPKQLRERSPVWQRGWQIITEIRFIEESERVHDLLSLDAKDRYEKFLSKYSHVADRISQKDIAFFIGVTPTSLNRIIRSHKLAK